MNLQKVNDLTLNDIRDNYAKIKSARPNLRARDIANELGVSLSNPLNKNI